MPFHQRFPARFDRPPDVYGRARGFTCGRRYISGKQHFIKDSEEGVDGMHDVNDFELWRDRRAQLLREAESYRLARRLRMAPREKSTRHRGRVLSRVVAALRIVREAT